MYADSDALFSRTVPYIFSVASESQKFGSVINVTVSIVVIVMYLNNSSSAAARYPMNQMQRSKYNTKHEEVNASTALKLNKIV
jgi:hypothetical protein